VLLLRGVPGRRDVGVWPHEDGERIADRRGLPLRIGLGHVAVERAVLAFVGDEIERQRRGHQPFGRRRDKIAEPRLADHRAERLGIILSEGGWGVHGVGALAIGCKI
jgi:hypothetical protein